MYMTHLGQVHRAETCQGVNVTVGKTDLCLGKYIQCTVLQLGHRVLISIYYKVQTALAVSAVHATVCGSLQGCCVMSAVLSVSGLRAMFTESKLQHM